MKEVAQKLTRSGRKDRNMSIRCSSLLAFSHSPGSEAFSGSLDVNQTFQSRGYCSNDAIMPWKFGNLFEMKYKMDIDWQK